MKRIALTVFLLMLVSCTPQTPDAPTENPPAPTPTTAAEIPPEEIPLGFVPIEPENPNATPAPAALTIDGELEMVFDWSEDACEPENIPDIAPRAFRDANGLVNLWIGHYVTYRMTGPDLNTLSMDCSAPLMRSDFDPDPSQFNDSEWLAAPYTEDGVTVYAIMHNEYRGDTHVFTRPGQCPSNDRLTCLDTSVTMAISTDGGATFHDILEPPNHMVATLPYVFNDQGVPSGLRQPSNVLKAQDGYFYVFTNISDYPANPEDFPPQWVCAMRTDNLAEPSSWRYWDGEGFNGRFLNPYTEDVGLNPAKCAPLDKDHLTASLNESITYNTELGRYVVVGYSLHPTLGEEKWGIYYAFSDDLIHWTQRQLLLELKGIHQVENPDEAVTFAYPTLLDPSSASLNFDTTDGDFYLYLSRFNQGVSLDRDLIRYPVHLELPVYDIPAPWRFDTADDTEGWTALNQINAFTTQNGRLTMHTTGGDPFFLSPTFFVPAEDYPRIGIRMKANGGGQTGGQIFFITEDDTEWDEAKSLVFDVTADGQFHDYVLDFSTVAGWKGVITQIRFDPVWETPQDVEIDIISFVE